MYHEGARKPVQAVICGGERKAIAKKNYLHNFRDSVVKGV